jgi:hypothetical protein
MSRPRSLALAVALAAACPAQTQVPGNTVVGTFGFRTSLVRDGCPPGDAGVGDAGDAGDAGVGDAGDAGNAGLPASFTGTVSYDSATGEAYLSFGPGILKGRLTGDTLELGGGAQRAIPSASCAGSLSEKLTARMIGEAEARAAGFSCDGFAGLDGGSASSEGGEDASGGDAGLDVQLICGSIKDVLSGPDAGEGDPCYLAPCEQVFSLTGERQ